MSETGAPAAPYEGFGGRVGRTFAGSESWWPERPTPRPDAPNVVVVLVDDLGFADLGCYGSEMATPNIDRLAAGGVQFTNFHVTPMCSPTRAALLTGVNPHRAGAGHVANSDPGFPGYAAELAHDVATAAELFRDAGYHTIAIGKWHLTKDADLSDAGPRHSWPCQRGFDRFYGVLDAFTNLHHPHRLVSDNHGGTTSYLRSLVSKMVKDMEDREFDRGRIDLAGGPQALVHYPRGWAMASNTPFRLYKINTHMGGHSVPFVFHWPAGQPGTGRRDQWAHVTDLVPTLCELAGVDRPALRNGVILQPLDGTSLGPVLADAGAAHERGPQHLEMVGHRGYYDGDWEVVTRHQPLTDFGDHEWELYNVAEDRSETRNLAGEHPDRVAEMAAGWEAAAQANQVYPLDEGSRLRYVVRPPYEEPLQQQVRIVAGTHTLERYRSQQLIQWRSFDVDVELRFATGDRGVLFSHGDQGGGYALYVDDEGELVFVHNGYGAMSELRCGPVPDGAESVRLAVTAPGEWRWDVEVSVDGVTKGHRQGLAISAPWRRSRASTWEYRRSPVSWALGRQHGSYRFTGRLIAVTYTPGEPAPDAGTRFIDLLREIGMRYE